MIAIGYHREANTPERPVNVIRFDDATNPRIKRRPLKEVLDLVSETLHSVWIVPGTYED